MAYLLLVLLINYNLFYSLYCKHKQSGFYYKCSALRLSLIFQNIFKVEKGCSTSTKVSGQYLKLVTMLFLAKVESI